MKFKIVLLLISFTILFSNCKSQNTIEKPVANGPQSATLARLSDEDIQEVIVPSITPSPKQATQDPPKTPTITATYDLNCNEPVGYEWSNVFSNDTVSITDILLLEDDSFLLSSSLDSFDGTILIKINADGEVIWEKKVPLFIGDLEPAPNGNILLVNSGGTIELDRDANIVQSVNTYAYLPQKDGYITLAKAGQVMRFTQPESPQWSYSFNNPETFIALTKDGGAISAYAGTYVDKSVYYMPFYTDIKINKIDASGQIWQRTYGKLIGDETLDYLGVTSDGGAILAGTHTYEELGSDYDIWVMKVNQTGAMTWQTTLKHAPESDYISNIMPLNNGSLVISEDFYTGSLRLIKLTKSGGLAWQKDIGSIRGPIIIFSAIDLSDGSLLFSGETREKEDVNFLAKLDSKGNIVWEKLIGFDSIENTASNTILSIYPMAGGDILIAGDSNLQGNTVTDKYNAWIARIKDKGENHNFLNLSPGKFSILNTLSSRPNNLPDEIIMNLPIVLSTFDINVEEINFQKLPVCLPADIGFPTPQALPSLTPSLTATLVFQRDLHLIQPDNLQGNDVVTLQQRLLALGYSEVGAPDGIFGKMTDNAVRLFQEKNGLEVDGYVGPITWKTLFSDTAIGK